MMLPDLGTKGVGGDNRTGINLGLLCLDCVLTSMLLRCQRSCRVRFSRGDFNVTCQEQFGADS
jgi:hypothetical protein